MEKLRAFTLMELVVTMVVAGILFGMAAVGFGFLTSNVDAAEAQSRLDRAAVAQQVAARDYGFYSPYGKDMSSAGLAGAIVENGAAVSQDPEAGQVSVAVASTGQLGLATRSPEGCLGMVVQPLDAGGSQERFELPSSKCSGLDALKQKDPQATLTVYTPNGNAWQD